VNVDIHRPIRIWSCQISKSPKLPQQLFNSTQHHNNTMSVFAQGQVLTVTTFGPGKLTLLTWSGVVANFGSVIGAKSTNNTGKTRWLISFSHNYTRFAFIWEGSGEAVYRIGTSLLTHTVGTTWQKASTVHWGDSSLVEEDVSANVSGATNRDGVTTFWEIPDTI